MRIKNFAVFCGSNLGNSGLYSEMAKELAERMSIANLGMVYGGAKVGLMGIIANHMLEKGSQVIGVIPQSLVDVEVAHDGLTQLHIVNSMHERKRLMSELADGFILMPGGLGSLEEFFEVLTLAQLGYHKKPCGILNGGGYYDYLLEFLNTAAKQGFIKTAHRKMILVEQNASDLINACINYQPPLDKKWISKTLDNNFSPA
ncbi:MAG: TIGR00730 family Rossman fold protein [Tatlockia sp.]|nr:TIGR00730 family Rossman fold protein [Tatlockia sp.]